MTNPFNTPNYTEQGGARTVIGGEIDVVTGGKIKIAGTEVQTEVAALAGQGAVAADYAKLHAITLAAAAINTLVGGVAASYKVARGQTSTVAASDDITSGLATVVAVLVAMDDDPVDGAMFATASIGNQAGAPAAGHFYLKTWKCTDADSTLIAATTFTKKVNWVAIGT